MPPKDKHLAQAKHNEDLILKLDLNVFSDWAMTLYFYTALHHVDAFCAAKLNYHPGSHGIRDQDVASIPDLQPIEENYMALKSLSTNARYYCARFKLHELARARTDELEKIKTHLAPFLV